MSPVGIHLIIDGWQVPPHLLNDTGHVRQALQRAVAAGGATLLELTVHQFQPQGLTATATLAESHMTIHTWPEWGYFAADVFFCGRGDAHAAGQALLMELQAKEYRIQELARGPGELKQSAQPEGRFNPGARDESFPAGRV